MDVQRGEGSTDPLSFTEFEESPNHLWQFDEPADESFTWENLLLEHSVDDGKSPVSNLPNTTALTARGSPCQCFGVAIRAIKLLSELQSTMSVQAVDRALRASDLAVQACDRFRACAASCHHNNVLLYMTVLELLDTRYSSMATWLTDSNTSYGPDLDIPVQMGNFKIQISLRSPLGKALLSSEAVKSAKSALELSRLFKTFAGDASVGETKYYYDVLAALSDRLSQNAHQLSCSSPRNVTI